MSSPCRCAEAIIARSIAMAMKPHGGKMPALIRPSPPARYGWRRIRSRCLLRKKAIAPNWRRRLNQSIAHNEAPLYPSPSATRRKRSPSVAAPPSTAPWSCLATHAAVLHVDGVERYPLVEKRFGVFDCRVMQTHPLTKCAAPRAASSAFAPQTICRNRRWRRRATAYSPGRRRWVSTCLSASEEILLLSVLQGHPEYAVLVVPVL